jgi:hypothetical protein
MLKHMGTGRRKKLWGFLHLLLTLGTPIQLCKRKLEGFPRTFPFWVPFWDTSVHFQISGCIAFRSRDAGRKNKKVSSPPVWWSFELQSSLIHLLLFSIQSPHICDTCIPSMVHKWEMPRIKLLQTLAFAYSCSILCMSRLHSGGSTQTCEYMLSFHYYILSKKEFTCFSLCLVCRLNITVIHVLNMHPFNLLLR